MSHDPTDPLSIRRNIARRIAYGLTKLPLDEQHAVVLAVDEIIMRKIHARTEADAEVNNAHL